MRADTMTTEAPGPEGEKSARRERALRRRLHIATGLLFLLALLNLGIGLAAWLGGAAATRLLYNGQTAALGAVFLVLAFFVAWRRSAPALGVAASLFAAKSLVDFLDAAGADKLAPAALGVRLLLLVLLLQGLAALRGLKRIGEPGAAPREGYDR